MPHRPPSSSPPPRRAATPRRRSRRRRIRASARSSRYRPSRPGRRRCCPCPGRSGQVDAGGAAAQAVRQHPVLAAHRGPRVTGRGPCSRCRRRTPVQSWHVALASVPSSRPWAFDAGEDVVGVSERLQRCAVLVGQVVDGRRRRRPGGAAGDRRGRRDQPAVAVVPGPVADAIDGVDGGRPRGAEERTPRLVTEPDIGGGALADSVGAGEAAEVAAEAILAVRLQADRREAGDEEAEPGAAAASIATSTASSPAPTLPSSSPLRRRRHHRRRRSRSRRATRAGSPGRDEADGRFRMGSPRLARADGRDEA